MVRLTLSLSPCIVHWRGREVYSKSHVTTNTDNVRVCSVSLCECVCVCVCVREKEKATTKKTVRALETDIRTYLQTQNGNTPNIFLMRLRAHTHTHTHTHTHANTHTYNTHSHSHNFETEMKKLYFSFPAFTSPPSFEVMEKQVVSKECVEHRKVIFSPVFLNFDWCTIPDPSIEKIFSLICIQQQQIQQQQ